MPALDTSLPPTLFDLEPVPEAPLEHATRPVWSAVTCHTCHEPLRRFVRQEPDGSWYRYELDHTAWDHLRGHEGGRLLLRLMPWGIGSINTIRRIRGLDAAPAAKEPTDV